MITVSIETAKKLKEAGWTKPTKLIYTNYYHGEPKDKMHLEFPAHTTDPNKLSAPTTDEILADLPGDITPIKKQYELAIFKNTKFYEAGYFIGEDVCYEISYNSSQLCEALADLWLWAKENGYIKAEKAGGDRNERI